MVFVVDDGGTEGFFRQTVLDRREGDENNRWFLRDHLSIPVVRLCMIDEVLQYEVQACADTDDTAAVLRADVVSV